MARYMVELFSGSGVMSKAFKAAGYEVLTLDNDPNLDADIKKDFLSLDLQDLPEKFRRPWTLWASPPCQAFSVASLSFHWDNHRPKSEKAKISLKLVNKLLQLIKVMEPEYFFIENPRGMLRVSVNGLPFQRHTITYCQYGENYQKPTDIWTNSASWIPRKMCRVGSLCHEASPRGGKLSGIQSLKGAYRRGIIPAQLCEEIVKSCEGPNRVLSAYG